MKKKLNVFYWSPYIGKIATVKSTINSAASLKKDKSNYNIISIINCFGEWNQFKKKINENKISIINLQNLITFKTNSYGFLKSRFIYLATFFITYFKLKKIIIEKKPNYLIVHLLTFIPFMLYLFNNLETKLVLRISGKPKLHFLRVLLWKIVNKKITLVLCPTIETKNILKKKKIFNNSKIFFLPDPVINMKEIKKIKKNKTKNIFKKYQYFLTIGRFTNQKNHELILNTIKKYQIDDKFLFIGDGELKKNIQNKIIRLKLQNQVKILNYKKNIFKFIQESKAVLISSLWEDPGFVMIEAAHLNKTIISSDCPSGPKEFLNEGKGGFLFKSNNSASLLRALQKFKKTRQKELNNKIIYAKDRSKIYTSVYHKKLLNKYLT